VQIASRDRTLKNVVKFKRKDIYHHKYELDKRNGKGIIVINANTKIEKLIGYIVNDIEDISIIINTNTKIEELS
jgi:hypothetical protein